MTTYKDAGVDIDSADATKRAMKESIDSGDTRVFNELGAFASLVQGKFDEYEEPVLVLKTEEPGSKQLLAFQQGRVRSICEDTINHLINDIAVMGAHPLYVQDAVICGKIEPDVVTQIVDGFAAACKAQDCVLVGGETSEQPGVLQPGTYILTTSIVGIVERAKVVNGSQIEAGDTVIALQSNGLHTNGYTLVRKLMEDHPDLASQDLSGESFMDIIMRPHTCYYQIIKGLYEHAGLTGMAHITGGGVQGNLCRVLPGNLDAQIDVTSYKVPEVFTVIQEVGSVPDEDMHKTYNMGVGLCLVVRADAAADILKHCEEQGTHGFVIGEIVEGRGEVVLG